MSADAVMMEQVVKDTVNIATAVQGTLLVLTGTLLLILLHRILTAKNWRNQSAVPGELKPIRFTGNNLPTGHAGCDVMFFRSRLVVGSRPSYELQQVPVDGDRLRMQLLQRKIWQHCSGLDQRRRDLYT